MFERKTKTPTPAMRITLEDIIGKKSRNATWRGTDEHNTTVWYSKETGDIVEIGVTPPSGSGSAVESAHLVCDEIGIRPQIVYHFDLPEGLDRALGYVREWRRHGADEKGICSNQTPNDACYGEETATLWYNKKTGEALRIGPENPDPMNRYVVSALLVYDSKGVRAQAIDEQLTEKLSKGLDEIRKIREEFYRKKQPRENKGILHFLKSLFRYE